MTADQLDKVLLLLAVVLCIVVALAYLLPRPRAAVTAYLFGIAFVPVWIGGDAASLITVHIGLALICLASLLLGGRKDPRYLRDGSIGRGDIRLFDVAIAVVVLLAVSSYAISVVDRGQVYLALTWALMYAVGRLASLRVGLSTIATTFVVMLSVVAVLALLEFATGFNPWLAFTGNSGSAFRVWGPQQYRGAFVRAEGAFGHSIALGAVLAIGIALTTATKLRTWLQLVLIALMTLALVVTFSRTGFVSAGLGVVLTVLFARGRIRQSLRIGLAVSLLVAIPLAFLATTAAFSEDEVSTDAALYRVWLWDLLPDLKAIGMSDVIFRGTDGTTTIGAFQSIDSAVLLNALTNGWVPTVILCVALAVAAIRLVMRGGDAALIAVVAQIPAFFTVALITQYAHTVWFVAGMAVTGMGAARSPARGTPRLVTAAESPELVPVA